MDTAQVLLRGVPFASPALGGSVAILLLGVVMVLSWFLLLATYAPFRESVGGFDQTIRTLNAYAPAFGSLFAYIKDLIKTIADTPGKLASAIGESILTLIGLAIAASVLLIFVNFQADIYATYAELVQCSPVQDLIWGLLMPLLNLGSLMYSVVIGFWNLYQSIMWLLYRFWETLLRRCATDSLLDFAAITRIFLNVSFVGRDLFSAVKDYFIGDIYEDRIELEEAFAQAGLTLYNLLPILDCACAFFSFIWTDAFALLLDPFLHSGLDCAVNAALKVVQSVLKGLLNFEVPQIEGVSDELICGLYGCVHTPTPRPDPFLVWATGRASSSSMPLI
jgi:hypothetical protein